MLRNVLFASAVVSIASCLTLFAAQATEDEAEKNVGKNKEQQAEKDEPDDKDGDDRQAAPSKSASQTGQWKNSDHCFASCVALGNQEEVALGKLASKKSENEDVKKFADMLVADHQMYLKKLQKFAPEATQEGCLDASKEEAKTEDRKPVQQADATDDATTEKTIEQTAGKRDTDTTRGKFAQAQIERELAQQCLMSSKAVLEEKSGPEFDKCFVGQQIAKHMGMRDKLIVYQRHASAELSEVFAAGQKKTEEHLAMAKDLMKSLEQASSSAK